MMWGGETGGRAIIQAVEPLLCALTPGDMPENWRPRGKIHETLGEQEWSDTETQDAIAAVREGLDELGEYFATHPKAISALGADAVEMLIDASYAAGNMPELRTQAREQARRALAVLIEPVLNRDPAAETCADLWYLLSLTAYTHTLYPAVSVETKTLINLTNASLHACGSLETVVGYDYGDMLTRGQISTDDAWELVMWSIQLTEAQSIAGLELPAGAQTLPEEIWRFFERHPFEGAKAYPDGGDNNHFYHTAYLATHLAYIPTGYGRYPIYVRDAPALYQFLRGNFYDVLETGELDLVAEFVDLFRQYGCTEKNDLQVRDGTRYLLRLFHAAGGRWMNHREPYEEKDISDYDLTHKAWTGMSGVRARIPEPPEPGTYGATVRAWLR
jgi:hypothetical protein